MSRLREALRFALVGSVGFAVDAGVLTLLVAAGLAVMPARAASFCTAVVTTYLLNSRYTFRHPQARRSAAQLAAYWGIQLAGAGVNFGVFWWLLQRMPALQQHLWLPLAVASLAAMGLTYALSRRLFGRQAEGVSVR